ncbi:MAG: IS200/IS605 family element transposase accessory protein TnpB [Hydrococcus sp. C42_A2020_068]|nr:IS200/IS605 family element transposase accessory protein TnpB [Hydrococcus sp. C42_A2020_068]
MTQALFVRCKLIVPVEFRHQIDETLSGFAAACNYILDVAKQEKCWHTTKLHHKVYKATREQTGLKANHVCQAIRRVIGNAKAVKQIHKFRPTSISLDARTFKYVEEKQQVGITLKSGQVNFGLAIGGYQVALLRGQVPTSATLSKTRGGDYYINIVVEIPTQPTGKTPKVLEVDLGIRDTATTSTGKFWDGKQLRETRAKYSRVRASIQSKRSKASKRLLRRLSGKERRMMAWVNHNISKQLVNDGSKLVAAIAFEDLTGIRQRAIVRKSQLREHNSWAFYQLRLFTEYKAAVAGIPIVLVDPRYTSKTCNCCKVIGNRDDKVFRCLNLNCGWTGDADHNGALNISALGAAVNQPGISTMFCSLEQTVLGIKPSRYNPTGCSGG